MECHVVIFGLPRHGPVSLVVYLLTPLLETYGAAGNT
jgi:hypothetical protein